MWVTGCVANPQFATAPVSATAGTGMGQRWQCWPMLPQQGWAGLVWHNIRALLFPVVFSNLPLFSLRFSVFPPLSSSEMQICITGVEINRCFGFRSQIIRQLSQMLLVFLVHLRFPIQVLNQRVKVSSCYRSKYLARCQ